MKKLCAILLCMTLLLSSFVFTEAAVTGTPYNNAVDFDSAAAGVITENSAKSLLGSIFQSWEGKLDGNTCEIIEDGYKGQALKLTSKGSGNKLTMKSVYFPETAGENAYFSFKFKVADNAGGSARYDFYNVGDSLFSITKAGYEPYEPRIFPSNGASIPYEVGKWYSVSLKYTCGEVGSPNRFDIVIEDEEGNVATGYRETTNGGTKSNKMLYVYDKTGIEGQSIIFDEFRMTYGQEETAPALVESNLGVIETPYTAQLLGKVDFNDYTGNLRGYLDGKPEMFAGNGMDDYSTGYVSTTPVDDCNGGLAPQITVFRNKTPFFNTVTNDFSTGKLFASLKIKMPENTKNYGSICLGKSVAGTDGSAELYIRGGNFEFWNYWGRGEKIPYIPNIWYTIVVEFEVKDGNKIANCYIYDDQNSLVVSRAGRQGAFGRPGVLVDGDVSGMISIFNTSQNTTDDLVTYVLDDIQFVKVTSDAVINTGNVIEKEILGKAPKGAVAETTTPVFNVKFDQIISDASTAKFVPAGMEDNSTETEEAVYEAAVIGEADFEDFNGNIRAYVEAETDVFNGNSLFIGEYVSSAIAEGYDGGQAAQITFLPSQGPHFNTITTDFSTGKTYTTFKAKFPETTDYLLEIGLGKASAGTDGSAEIIVNGGVFDFRGYWGTTDVTYTPDTWYTFVIEFEVKDGNKVANCYIYDAQNNLVTSRAGKQGAFARPLTLVDGDVSGMISLSRRKQAYNSEFYLDDVKMIKVTSDSAIDTATVIAREIFGEVPVEEPEDDAVASEVLANIIYLGSDNIKIVPVEPLEYGTDYVLKLEDVVGLGGVACDTAELNFATIPYSLGTMTYADPVYDGTTATVEVDFVNAAISKVNAKVIGALYEGDKLVWSSVKALTDASKEDCVITFANLPEDAQSKTFKLFVWDNFEVLSPLFKSAE